MDYVKESDVTHLGKVLPNACNQSRSSVINSQGLSAWLEGSAASGSPFAPPPATSATMALTLIHETLPPLRTLHGFDNEALHTTSADSARGVGLGQTLIVGSPLKRPRQELHAHASFAAHPVQDYLGLALKSVVKIFATTAAPNFATPWQMHHQGKSTATGWVIAPLSTRRIITNAHAVANQIQVQVRKHSNARKFTARVLAVGHECDLAMLTVDDDDFWTGVGALDVAAEVPAQQESVSVVGYPTGGDNVCVTKGVVSRIDRQRYSHGCTSLLTLQIDAAINSGNSGGPVLLADKVVGVAFQCLTSGENIGYVIPAPVINHFLDDLVRHQGRYTGFCCLGAVWQSLESTTHKAALGMPQDLTGVYLTSLEPCHPSAQVLLPGDVITHFNGHAIADDGTFLFEPNHPNHHITRHSPPLRTITTSPTATSGPNTPLTPNRLQPPSSTTSPTDGLSFPTLAITAAAGGGDSMSLSPTNSNPGPLTTLDTTTTTTTSANHHNCQQQQHVTTTNTSSAITLASAVMCLSPNKVVPAMSQLVISSPRARAQMLPPPSPLKAVTHYGSAAGPVSPYRGAGGNSRALKQQQAAHIDFRHLVAMNFEGDECQLGVWRDGSMLPGGAQVRLITPKQLVPIHSHDIKPQYFIFGGFVFTPLTYFYLKASYGNNWPNKAPVKLCDRAYAGRLQADGQECVILSKVLAWPDVNTGYQDLHNVEVLRVAGVPVHNLAHMAHMLTHHPGPYVRLDLQWDKVVVMDVARCRAALQDILVQNCIPGAGHYPDTLLGPLQLPGCLHEATDMALRGAGVTTQSLM